MNSLKFLCALFLLSFFSTVGSAEQLLADKFVEAANSLENPNVIYDGAYRQLNYPLGDVPADKGVCTDVIIRAYRLIGIDLQKRVHEDMSKHFSSYPADWGLTRADKNIDHRRVPNLRVFFKRHGAELENSNDPKDYKPGDIVTWNLSENTILPHIGIVTDKRSSDQKRPLIMHNIGSGQVFEDILFAYRITGHYRYALD